MALMDEVSLAKRKEKFLSDYQLEALSLLMADPNLLPSLSLSALQQLQYYQQHALSITQRLIQSYPLTHPTGSCLECEDEPTMILYPCQHVVLCEECAQECEECPWVECKGRVESVERMVGKLPPPLQEPPQ